MLGWDEKWVSQNQHTTMLTGNTLTGHPFPLGHQDLCKGSCVYIYGVVRTTAGPLQKEQSAFIIKTEGYCLKLHEGLLSKGEYCHRENKLLQTRPLLIPVHQNYSHTECWTPHFKRGSVLFEKVDTSRDVIGLCERIRLLLCFLYPCHVYVKWLISENSQNFVNRRLAKSRL